MSEERVAKENKKVDQAVQIRVEKVIVSAWKSYLKEMKEFPTAARPIMMYPAERYYDNIKAIYTDGDFLALLKNHMEKALLATDANVRRFMKKSVRHGRSRLGVHMYMAVVDAAGDHFRKAVQEEFSKPGAMRKGTKTKTGAIR